jgi:hypothetical protein
MLRKVRVNSLNDFSGGLNTKIKELNGMKPQFTPNCMDVYADLDGSLHKRLGRTKLNSVQAGAGTKDCHGLFDFEGTLIGSFGTTYYKMDELDGTFDSLQTGMKDEVIECEDYDGNLIVCNWGNDLAKTMQVGDTSMSSYNTVSVAGKGKHPKEYKDHIVMSGVPGYDYTFYYTEVSDFDDYANGGTWPVRTHDGDILQGWAKLQGRLYAVKRWSIHQMTYRGGSPYWVRRQITSGVGTRSPLTIKNVTLRGGEEVVMFLGADRKLYQFDGYDAKPVSDNFEENNGICPISMATLNQGSLDYCHAVVDPVKHWYILYVGNGGTTTMTHGLVYNYFTGACWPFSNQTLKSSVAAIDANGKRWVIAGDYDGYAYRMEYGNKDSATTISAYHTTPRLLLKKDETEEYDQVVISLKAISDDTVAFQHREDYSETWRTAHNITLGKRTGDTGSEYYLGVTGSFVLGTATLGPVRRVVEDLYTMDVAGEYLQFKLSDSLTTGPWTLYSYSFTSRSIGVVKQEV